MRTTLTILTTVFVALSAASRLGAQEAASAPDGVDAAAEGVRPVDPESVPRPMLQAMRASTPLVIDGVLDEADWKSAPVATGFVQTTPDTGYPATENTEVRILYDDRTLYIGAMLYDRDPEGIVARRMEQDFLSLDEDIFGFSLDTFLDRRNAYYFMINANGAVRDGQAYDNSRTSNTEWEGIMEVKSSVHEEGWSVEIAIPFSTLRFDPSLGEQDWGVNFLRRVRRKSEDSYWAPVARRTRLHKMDEAGTLVGLSPRVGGRNITVKPFALGASVSGQEAAVSELGRSADGGIDVKWGITPRLTADLSWRTDFSQVEVDQEQVNLTRFSLFFPEKREFFVENSGTYQFGDLSERNYRLGASPRDFTLFHSRRIGLDGGVPVPIVAGARITGRAAGMEVGLINMQTEETSALAPENFSVARLRRTLLGVLDVGGIFINRQTTSGPEDYNRSWGVDANLRIGPSLKLHSYLAQTHEPGLTGGNRAARVSVAWRDAFWNTSVLFRTIGESFRPDVGFVRRTAVRHYYATVGVHPTSGYERINEINPYLEVERFTDLNGTLETESISGAVAVAFLDGGRLTLQGSDRFELLTRDFNLSGGVVPAGSYDFREGSIRYVASAARTVSGQVRVSGGEYFQGDRRSVGGSLVLRPNAHFAIDLGVDHNVVDLTGESFTVDVLSGRVDYLYSTKFLVGAWVQFNEATHEMITNLRLNFIHSPLSDLFLVYSERRLTDASVVVDRRFTVKLTKLLAF